VTVWVFVAQERRVIPEELGLGWTLLPFWGLGLVFNCPACSAKSICAPHRTAEAGAE